jgi:hypothetical protein
MDGDYRQGLCVMKEGAWGVTDRSSCRLCDFVRLMFTD